MIDANATTVVLFVGTPTLVGFLTGFLKNRSVRDGIEGAIILGLAGLFFYAALISPKWRGGY